MLIKTGVPEISDIMEVMPSSERLKRGPVAIIECFQEIPCNPCYTSCPNGAIGGMENINKRPVLDFEACTGCGICIGVCPGLAIFVLDYEYEKDTSVIRIPYEFLPVPKEGEKVIALDRYGEGIGIAKVVKVQKGSLQNKTLIIWLEVNREQAFEVRNFKMGGYNGG